MLQSTPINTSSVHTTGKGGDARMSCQQDDAPRLRHECLKLNFEARPVQTLRLSYCMSVCPNKLLQCTSAGKQVLPVQPTVL